jgi:predicted molibdopterin-dependent oxidoreductase YjgC
MSSASGRLAKPLVKRNGKLTETTWDEAVKLLAERLPAYQGAFGSIVASRLTNEDAYVSRKFAQQVMGAASSTFSSPVDDDALVEPLAGMLGYGASTNPLDDMAAAKCLLLFGSDPTLSHPIAAWQARRSARFTGGHLIVASPRRIELTERAQLWLQYRPGAESALVAGLLSTILEEGLSAQAFIAANTQGLEALQASLAGITPAQAAERTGVAEADIRAAARSFAGSPASAIAYDASITQFTNDGGAVAALVNLALLTGQVGKPGAGVHVLRSGGNAQGMADMGLESTAARVLDSARAGEYRALFIAGDDLAAQNPNAAAAIQRAEFTVVAATSLTATAQLADVVLPLAAPLEQEGTVTNSERRVQPTAAVLPAHGQSRPLWQAVQAIAAAMNAQGFQATSAEAVFAEIVQHTPAYQGLTYEAIGQGGQQWGGPVLYTGGFPNGRAQFRPVAVAESPAVTAEFPLLVAAGREPLPYHIEVQTAREDPYTTPWDEELLKLHPQDAERLGVAAGQRVRLVTPQGELTAQAGITESVPAGVVLVSLPIVEDGASYTAGAAELAAQVNGARLMTGRIER